MPGIPVSEHLVRPLSPWSLTRDFDFVHAPGWSAFRSFRLLPTGAYLVSLLPFSSGFLPRDSESKEITDRTRVTIAARDHSLVNRKKCGKNYQIGGFHALACRMLFTAYC